MKPTAKPRPTRANRPNETQPLPVTTSVSEDVTPALCVDFIQLGEARGEGPSLLDAIITDLAARLALGVERYGKPLQTWNGRDATLDAYEEALDLTQYLKQRCMEHPSDGHFKIALWNAMSLVLSLKKDVTGR